MSQLFFGKPAPTFQSTPKPGHHPSSPKVNEGKYDCPDSGIDISNISNRRNVHNSTSSELPGEETTTVLSSTIGKKAQDLIERINQSRAMDQEIMTTFENKLMNKVSEVCQQVKEQMFSSYEEHGCGMEANLKELSEVLERSSQLSMELQGASQTLSAINNSLQQTAEN
uniref:Synaptonemal complex central element protein 2 n=1 Tax=Oncorhynchus mykiss TaxID=8022 RepID=A0A8C7VQS7_ONCMY